MDRRGAVIAALVLLLGAASLAADTQSGEKVLVLLESLDLQHSHSEFFSSLSSRGYTLDFKQISDKGLQLKDWDTWLYTKVIVFATKGGALPPQPAAPPLPPHRRSLLRRGVHSHTHPASVRLHLRPPLNCQSGHPLNPPLPSHCSLALRCRAGRRA